jgi:hypothetical protein
MHVLAVENISVFLGLPAVKTNTQLLYNELYIAPKVKPIIKAIIK